MKTPKYIVMNGSFGCIPDNTMLANSIESAIDSIKCIFDCLPRGAIASLRNYHYYSFPDSCKYGADYVEIALNTEGITEDDI